MQERVWRCLRCRVLYPETLAYDHVAGCVASRVQQFPPAQLRLGCPEQAALPWPVLAVAAAFPSFAGVYSSVMAASGCVQGRNARCGRLGHEPGVAVVCCVRKAVPARASQVVVQGRGVGIRCCVLCGISNPWPEPLTVSQPLSRMVCCVSGCGFSAPAVCPEHRALLNSCAPGGGGCRRPLCLGGLYVNNLCKSVRGTQRCCCACAVGGWTAAACSATSCQLARCGAHSEGVVAWSGAVYLSALGRLRGRAGVCAGAGCARVLSQTLCTAAGMCLPEGVGCCTSRVWAVAQAPLPCTAAQHWEPMACVLCRCKIQCHCAGGGYARRVEEEQVLRLG